jgi:hypothetical protein
MIGEVKLLKVAKAVVAKTAHNLHLICVNKVSFMKDLKIKCSSD